MPTNLPRVAQDVLHAEGDAADLGQLEPGQRAGRGRPRVSSRVLAVIVATAGVAVIAAIMSITGSGWASRAHPAAASSAGTTASTTGTIAGQLLAVGGPAGTPNRPLAGTVSVTNIQTRHRQSVSVGADGRYSVRLAPGTYLVEGRSPSYGDGAYPCQVAGPVHVTADATARSDVTCQEK